MPSLRPFALGSLIALGLGVSLAWAEETSSSTEACSATVVSVTSRPTVTSATDTTLCGVVELEYALERQWPGGDANRDDLTGELRFGLTPNLDFHWSSSAFVHLINGSGNRTGFGDNWLGLRYRFLRQTKRHPSLGVFYAGKVPSANPAFTSTMLGCSYVPNPRLALDSGVDDGVTSAAPRKWVFVGITYAIGNVYSWMRAR